MDHLLTYATWPIQTIHKCRWSVHENESRITVYDKKRLKLGGAEAYVYAQRQITSNNLDYKRY